ncbi:hypothetical protein Lal_00010131 [Lupinus albus]|nr:hypothetical protein Lal_00010131 [Lupinus albus]
MTSPQNTLVVATILLLFLSFSKLSLTTFVSIDCGSYESTIDTNNITWIGDDAYIQFGESHQIPSAPSIFNTLRAFPYGNESCYSIEVENGEKVLTRATFFYGNYDNKSSPPIFDLHFDGNFWASVNTSMASSEYNLDYEAIYATKGNTTNICVTQKMPNHIPFITSLEVRSLNSTMYSQLEPNHSLILLGRYAFGADKSIRYPDDAYDRIWKTVSGDGLISRVKSDALNINISTVVDNPPQAAMNNAVTTPDKDHQILYHLFIPHKEVPLYINTYFSEVTKDAAGARSIEIHVDSNPVYGPIAPPFGSVEEVYIKKSLSQDTSLAFVARPDSTLPPILNAIEVYQIQPLAIANATDT